MPGRKRYDPQLVHVILREERPASWTRPGGETVRGQEAVYSVEDFNFDRLKYWTFAVRISNRKSEDIAVQPLRTPPKHVWAGLERHAILFVRATKHPYRSKVYCKVFLADSEGVKNKIGISYGQRGLLPEWFDYFKRDMRLKDTVTTTASNDGAAQVVVSDPRDHERMIRLYIAMRAWVLQEHTLIDK